MRSAGVLLLAVAAAGEPTLELSKKKCSGVAAAGDVAADGDFTIRVTVAGKKGYAYTCDAAYDAASETTDKECAGWLPQQVRDDNEDLDVTLEAIDSTGKRAVCMLWNLAFGASDVDAWKPADYISEVNPVKSASDFFNAMVNPLRVATPQNVPGYDNNTGNPDCVHDPKCNSPAIRGTVAHAYLDSMTYVSHACVPKKVNDIAYGDQRNSAFPPGLSAPALLRVSHKALAISGMIHSIDRTCKEAWNIGKGESCVSFNYLHCHTSCSMTWHMGPGGVATWGMTLLNHHIPSPGLNLVQQFRNKKDTAYGNLGCGGGDVPPPAQYRCKDGQCVAADSGTDIDTCHAAC